MLNQYCLCFSTVKKSCSYLSVTEMSTSSANKTTPDPPSTPIDSMRVEAAIVSSRSQGDSTTRSEAATDPPSAPEDSMVSSDPNSSSTTCSNNPAMERTTATPNDDRESSSEKKKRGNQSVFHGEQKEYLQQRAPEYLALQTRVERTAWLTGLIEEWFSKWPWHRGNEPEEFQVLNTPSDCQTLTPEEFRNLKDRRKTVHDAVVKLGQEVGPSFRS